MNELTKILATIRRPFQQEIRSGCKDSVVINGLGAYVQLWVRNAEQLTLNPTEKQMLTSLAESIFRLRGAIADEAAGGRGSRYRTD